MSDPEEEMEDVYRKYVGNIEGNPATDTASSDEAKVFAEPTEQPCPRCGSLDIDTTRGYRGEYRCNKCRHTWQVGGKDSRI